jgi:hypothetical protein
MGGVAIVVIRKMAQFRLTDFPDQIEKLRSKTGIDSQAFSL